MSKPYDPLASVQAAGPPGTISFVYGLPDPETFPGNDLKRCFDRVLREKAALALQYGPEQGFGPLIDYLREKILLKEGITLERPQIKLTGGASQALDHLCTLLTRPGEYLLVEAPTYHEALQLFRNHGLRPLSIPTDDDGLIVDELAASLQFLKKKRAKARFLYTIPTFQNPSGITLSEERREAVLVLAEKEDLLIVEDDVYFELAYEPLNVSPLFSLDKNDNVIRLGSFSKIIAPGLRLGWMMGPVEIIDQLTKSGLRRMGGGAHPLTANAVAMYCQENLLEPHLEFVRTVYSKRRDVMLEALEAMMPDGISWTRPGGGFFVWIILPETLPVVEIVKWAKEEGILLLAGDPFFAGTSPQQHLRLAFSYVHPEKIREGIKKFAHILKAHL